jgi:hypothetical protein
VENRVALGDYIMKIAAALCQLYGVGMEDFVEPELPTTIMVASTARKSHRKNCAFILQPVLQVWP